MDKHGRMDDGAVSSKLYLLLDDSIRYEAIWEESIIHWWGRHNIIKISKKIVPGRKYLVDMTFHSVRVCIVTVSSWKILKGQDCSMTMMVVRKQE